MKALLYGIYINVAVDIALALFLGFPLLRGIQPKPHID